VHCTCSKLSCYSHVCLQVGPGRVGVGDLALAKGKKSEAAAKSTVFWVSVKGVCARGNGKQNLWYKFDQQQMEGVVDMFVLSSPNCYNTLR
jgi:hypothetical protein